MPKLKFAFYEDIQRNVGIYIFLAFLTTICVTSGVFVYSFLPQTDAQMIVNELLYDLRAISQNGIIIPRMLLFAFVINMIWAFLIWPLSIHFAFMPLSLLSIIIPSVSIGLSTRILFEAMGFWGILLALFCVVFGELVLMISKAKLISTCLFISRMHKEKKEISYKKQFTDYAYWLLAGLCIECVIVPLIMLLVL